MTNGRNRRGSVSSPRHDTLGTDPIDIAAVPPRHVIGKSKRASLQVPQGRKLAPDQVVAIRALAGSKSLRSLAADFGASHEAIWAALGVSGVGREAPGSSGVPDPTMVSAGAAPRARALSRHRTADTAPSPG